MYDDGEIRDTDMSKRGFLICERPGPGGRSVSSSGKADPGGTSHHSAKKAAWTPLGLDERTVIGRRKLSSMAPRPPAEYARDASAYVIEAVSRLGEAGGVAPLANRISEGGGRASFGEVLETFRMDKALRTHASAKAIKEVHWILKECAAAAMLSVPPESMRAATKAEIAECISCVRDLAMAGVRASHPPHELMQEIEQLELAMAMKVRKVVGGGWRGVLRKYASVCAGDVDVVVNNALLRRILLVIVVSLARRRLLMFTSLRTNTRLTARFPFLSRSLRQ